MSELPRPTEFELAILRVLWRRQLATVRQVLEDLQKERRLGYNTVLKTMLILLEKGLVLRDDAQRSHIYRAAVEERETQADLLRDLLQRAFGGSAKRLVMAAIDESPLSPEETAEIKDYSLLRARSKSPRDLRAARRVPFERRVRFWTQDRRSSEILAVNISRSGLLLGGNPMVPVGQACEVGLPPAGPLGSKPFLAKGMVVRSDERGTAIRFLSALDRKHFEEFILSQAIPEA